MRKLLCAAGLLLLATPGFGAYVVRIRDLSRPPAPPNPITVAGRVTSGSPLMLSDGSGEISVAGMSASLSDFLVLTGDWDGSVLTVTGSAGSLVGPALTEMAYISAGAFLMGNNGGEPYVNANELPQHSVYLSGYWIGRYEVTRGEYRRFIEAGGYGNSAYWSSTGWTWKGSRTEPNYWAATQTWFSGQTFTQTDAYPVVGVSYYEAEAFCTWAGGHLPTEAQWEKAARWTGTYPNVYPWGNAWDAQRCNNWYDTNPAGGGYVRYQTAPAGSFPSGAGPYGLHDMAGNVWELCSDWYASDYYSASPPSDPEGPATGGVRVMRGGGFYHTDRAARCSARDTASPGSSSYDRGFRLAR